MSFSYLGNSSATGTGVSSLTCNRPTGTVAGTFIVAVFAFENVAAGSGPWIIPNIGQYSTSTIGPFTSWLQLCWQGPSAAGVGIEVWGAIHASGTSQVAQFVGSENVVCVCAGYSGEYNPTGLITSATVRVASTAQVTGNQPPAPSVDANVGELIVACGGDLMTGSGFGAPSGFTNRVDAARGAAGTVEATIADATALVAGTTGPITFPNNAAATTTKGATATLLVRPVPPASGSGGIIDAGMPEDLDIGPGYTLRVAALDPTTGDPVSGVTVSNLIFTAEQIAGTPEGLETGPFMLVPGPGA